MSQNIQGRTSMWCCSPTFGCVLIHRKWDQFVEDSTPAPSLLNHCSEQADMKETTAEICDSQTETGGSPMKSYNANSDRNTAWFYLYVAPKDAGIIEESVEQWESVQKNRIVLLFPIGWVNFRYPSSILVSINSTRALSTWKLVP